MLRYESTARRFLAEQAMPGGAVHPDLELYAKVMEENRNRALRAKAERARENLQVQGGDDTTG